MYPSEQTREEGCPPLPGTDGGGGYREDSLSKSKKEKDKADRCILGNSFEIFTEKKVICGGSKF